MSFISAAAYGVLFRNSSDPRLTNNVGVLAPLGSRVRQFVYTVGFSTLIGDCRLDNTLAYLAYRRSAEIDWAALNMESPFLLYYFQSGTVEGLSDGGAYDGRRLDGVGSSRTRAGFPAVEDVCRGGPKCDYDEAAAFMGVVARRPPSSGAVTGASLLQEVATARAAFTALADFCRSQGIAVPRSLNEALPLIQGWYTQGQDSLAAVCEANEATVAETAKVTEVTRAFDAYKERQAVEFREYKADKDEELDECRAAKDVEIGPLKSELEAGRVEALGRMSTAAVNNLKATIANLKTQVRTHSSAVESLKRTHASSVESLERTHASSVESLERRMNIA